MIIEKRGLTPEVYSILGLDFPDENGTISVRDVNIKPLPITDEAIQNVPNIHSSLLTDEQNIKLQKSHQELLKFVKDEPLGREAMAIYDMDINLIYCVKGKELGRVKGKSLKGPQILIHNHPSGETFTIEDFTLFLEHPEIVILTAVDNAKGKVYVIEKQEDFNTSGLIHYLNEQKKLFHDWESSPEKYIRFMKRVLKEVKHYGFQYYVR